LGQFRPCHLTGIHAIGQIKLKADVNSRFQSRAIRNSSCPPPGVTARRLVAVVRTTAKTSLSTCLTVFNRGALNTTPPRFREFALKRYKHIKAAE
jgi:hypothetical protein